MYPFSVANFTLLVIQITKFSPPRVLSIWWSRDGPRAVGSLGLFLSGWLTTILYIYITTRVSHLDRFQIKELFVSPKSFFFNGSEKQLRFILYNSYKFKYASKMLAFNWLFLNLRIWISCFSPENIENKYIKEKAKIYCINYAMFNIL